MRQEARMGEGVEETKSMSCEQAMKELFLYLDRALGGEPLEAFEAHLRNCLNCCDRVNFSRSLDSFVKERLGDVPLPQGIEQRIRRAIDERTWEG